MRYNRSLISQDKIPMIKNTAFSAIMLSVCIASGAQTTPSRDIKPDPAAVAALKAAHDQRDTFAPGFTGLTAAVTINDNGQEVKGNLTYSVSAGLKLNLTGATTAQQTWAEEQIGSAFAHRKPDDFAAGEGSKPLTFGKDDNSPLGKEICLNDRMNSLYRVKDGHITQVTRMAGPAMRFTITVLSDRNLPGGKYLPTQFTVTYFDAKTGGIKQVDFFSDKFSKVGDSWVPSARRLVTAENGGFVTRSFTLEDMKALNSSTASR
jgi:Protein of unknown function (DUF3386)